MKRIWLWALVFMLSVHGALAETADCGDVYVEVPIWPSDIAVWDDTSLLLSGVRVPTSAPEKTASMVLLDVSGQLLWQDDETKRPSPTQYSSAVQVDQQTIVALLKDEENAYFSTIRHDGGKRYSAALSQAEITIRHFMANDAGILCSGTLESSHTSRLVQFDENWEALWTLDLDAYIVALGILQGEGIHYVFGHKITGSNDCFEGIVLAVDSTGRLVWAHDNSDVESFAAGHVLNDGSILLAGAQHPDGTLLSCYGADGVLWKKQLPASSVAMGEVQLRSGKATSIVPYQGDVLVACEGICYPGNGAWLYRVNAQGDVLAERYAYTDRISSREGCELLMLQGKVYLLLHGMASTVDGPSWQSGATIGDSLRGFYLVDVASLI